MSRNIIGANRDTAEYCVTARADWGVYGAPFHDYYGPILGLCSSGDAVSIPTPWLLGCLLKTSFLCKGARLQLPLFGAASHMYTQRMPSGSSSGHKSRKRRRALTMIRRKGPSLPRPDSLPASPE